MAGPAAAAGPDALSSLLYPCHRHLEGEGAASVAAAGRAAVEVGVALDAVVAAVAGKAARAHSSDTPDNGKTCSAAGSWSADRRARTSARRRRRR
eukprot:1589930-Prymnesium_polylepis.1